LETDVEVLVVAARAWLAPQGVVPRLIGPALEL
jgi:hypothetical protein